MQDVVENKTRDTAKNQNDAEASFPAAGQSVEFDEFSVHAVELRFEFAHCGGQRLNLRLQSTDRSEIFRLVHSRILLFLRH